MNDKKEFEENYKAGYRNGRLDFLYLGFCSRVALNSTLCGYKEGYADGQRDAENGEVRHF